MSKTVAQHQADYRARRTEKLARMETALTAIAAKLDGKTGTLAVEVHGIAKQGLGQ